MPGFIGKYEVLRTIGRGVSCKAKLAVCQDTGRKVAIKVMNEDLDEKMKELVMTEVNALKSMAPHMNVIQILECG